MSLSKLSLKQKVGITVTLPVIYIFIISGISYYASTHVEQANKWVEHTHAVISKATNLLASAVDMETGMRGYLLAGEEDFLDPYKSGKASFMASAFVFTSTLVFIMKTASGLPCTKGCKPNKEASWPAGAAIAFRGLSIMPDPAMAEERIKDLLSRFMAMVVLIWLRM